MTYIVTKKLSVWRDLTGFENLSGLKHEYQKNNRHVRAENKQTFK